MKGTSCNSLSDCNVNEQICQDSECYCTTLAARKGDDCGEMTTLSYISGVGFLLLGIVALVLFGSIIKIFVKNKKKIFGGKLTANTTSLIWATVVNFLHIIFCTTLGLRVLGVLTETQSVAITSVFPGIMGLFFTAMFLNMSFMWAQVYQSSKKATKSGSNVGKAKYIFIGLGLMFLLLVIIMALAVGTTGVGLVTLAFSVLFIGSYLYGGRKLSKLLSGQSEDMKNTAKAISQTSIGVGVGLTLYDLCILIFIIGSSRRHAPLAFLGMFLAMAFIIFLLRVMTKYLTRTFKDKKKLKQSKLGSSAGGKKIAPATAAKPT